MRSQWNDHQDTNESPNTHDTDGKDTMAQLLPQGHQQERMNGNGQHEKTTGRVSNLQPEPLQETSRRVTRDLVFRNPF